MVEALRPGRAALAILGLAAATLLAPYLARHAPNSIADPGATRDRPPGTHLTAVELRDGTLILADRVLASADGTLAIERRDRQREFVAADRVAKPASIRRYILGTDALGRDLLARLLHGWRNSLAIAAIAMLLALLGGTTVGLLAAYAGGRTDRWAMSLVDIAMALPKLFLLLAVAAALEPGPVLLVLLLAALSWMPIARLARAEASALRRADFSLAARATGCSATEILLRHYLPHLRPMLTTLALLQLSDLILLEAALSFVGAGLAPPTPTLGGLVADAALRGSTTWWMLLFPGAAIALASLASRWAAGRDAPTLRSG